MDTLSSLKLPVLLIVAVVLPASVLALVSLGAITGERAQLELRDRERYESRTRELADDLALQALAPLAEAEAWLASRAPSASSGAELDALACELAAASSVVTAALCAGPDGERLARRSPARPTGAPEGAALARLLRPALDLELRAEQAQAALACYEAIAQRHRGDPLVEVEVLAARARLAPRVDPYGGGGERAAAALAEIAASHPFTPGRAGSLLAPGALLELATRERADGPAREAARLDELARAAALAAALLGEDERRFYGESALERLTALDPARALRARDARERIARAQAAAAALWPAVAGDAAEQATGGRERRRDPWLVRLGDALLLVRAVPVDIGFALPRAAGARAGSGTPAEPSAPAPPSLPGPARAVAYAYVAVDLAEVHRERLAPQLADAALHDGLDFVLVGPAGSGAAAEPPAGPGPLFEAPLGAPLEGLRLVAAEAAGAPGEPFGVLGEGIRLWTIGVLLVGLVFGTVMLVRAVHLEVQSAKLKSDFVTTVTHELKTPLTSIGMFAETLLMGRAQDAAEQNECLEIIAKETERLSRLIDRVLTFSKIEAKRKRFQLKLEALPDLVEDTVRLFKQQMRGGRPFEVEVVVLSELKQVLCDRGAIQEVLLNLLSNAYKYGAPSRASARSRDPDAPPEAEPTTRIQVSVTKRRGWAEVQVRDWGIGIAWREQRRIFAKFYRTNDVLTRDVEGSGIGLTLARSIARAHRGDVTVRSRLGQGSTFSLWLPIPRR